ncbi:MAG: BamA/TamA family outer membrane protein [Parabacteroides sp.]|nr:BamA/TamA family outer membrane protein [Parabacteroides sp.]
MKSNIYSLLFFIILLASCSTTKNLPEGEVLYTGIHKLEIVNEDKSNEGKEALTEIEAALSYPPNNALLGSSSIRIPFPFGLWVYNAFVNKKGKMSKWIFDKLAAKPVLINTVNPNVRTQVAANLLREYGYFKGSTSYDVETDPKDPKKAKINYRIEMNKAYTYDSIAYVRLRHRIDTLLQHTYDNRLIKKGDNFNVVQLEAERQRIASLLRNNGYYYFRPEFITYQADTLLQPGKVALRVSTQPGLPRNVLRPWKVGNISVFLNGYNNEIPTDSIHYKDITIFYEGKLRVRPNVLYNQLRLHTGDIYSQELQEKTQTNFANLGIFRYSEMQYTPKDSSRRCDTLNLQINTVYDLPLDGELELNVTTKSNNQTGPGAVFSVTKRNIFGGGETFGVSLRGSYEWQTGKRVTGSSSAINSWELGVSGTLTYPQILFPKLFKRDLDYPSSTAFRIYIDQLNRAKFFKMLAFGGSAAYEYQPSATSHHSITPFKLTYSLLQRTTAEFDSIVTVNPALRQSLENQFIPAIGYTYTYDDSPITTKQNHLWWQSSITQAGLIIDAIYAATGKGFNQQDKKLFGNRFAQFIKATSEIRYNYNLGEKQHLVGRLIAGVAYSYGNATTTPYSEQFYIGGANSIRAFTIRSIGPGSFRPTDSQYGYLDQTGDIKFEANLEYRFPILGDLFGAAFLDAGNVWLIREDENRPGGQLKWGRFWKDLALGTGIGLRYDLSFLVIRLDWGIGLHVPYDTGKKGYYNIPKFRDGTGIHLAIGYPF